MKEVNGWHFPDNDTLLSKHAEPFPNTNYQQLAIDAAYQHVKNFDCIIDAGANVGLHSVRFAKNFKDVYSFEPVKSNFECLEKNTHAFSNIHLLNCGLGEKNYTAEIFLPKDQVSNCGAHSIVDFKDYTGEVLKEEIEIKTIDEYQLSPSLIKIDTQGYEINVLMGAVNTLKRSSPVIIAECENTKSFNRVNNFLTTLGYVRASSVKKDKIWIKA